jgi:hypothetical protein
MNNNLDSPYYYLENFHFVLAWVLQRYSDLLEPDEVDFIKQFTKISVQSQALLVRMVMRKGDLFRASKLTYEEIGDTEEAARSLIDQGWLQIDPWISLEQLFHLLTKKEFAQALSLARDKTAKKIDLLESAQANKYGPRRFSEWSSTPTDVLYEVRVSAMCDRIRLMFFGNLNQDWAEFVLADLGIFTYEKVAFSDASRAFHHRRDIDTYLHLHTCRERLHDGEELQEIERDIHLADCDNPWLLGRRAKLLFQLGQAYEQIDDGESAIRTYAQCDYPGARSRRIRVLEKNGQITDALKLAETAFSSPESDAEVQHLTRIMPRLQRKLGHTRSKVCVKSPLPCIDLVLPKPADLIYVEEVARSHIEQTSEDTPVYYVENTLINSLFGLLCWDAIFSAVPGAFFHPFQAGPADLHSTDFHKRRTQQFQRSLARLASQQYKQTIRDNFHHKAGIQSPFVSWNMLSEGLLEQALRCFPADHLAKWFERILDGVAANRSGFPDLIQFWPQEERYRMIEVKGPGDRLQDNQIRFLDFCLANDMPVAICYVEWESTVT